MSYNICTELWALIYFLGAKYTSWELCWCPYMGFHGQPCLSGHTDVNACRDPSSSHPVSQDQEEVVEKVRANYKGVSIKERVQELKKRMLRHFITFQKPRSFNWVWNHVFVFEPNNHLIKVRWLDRKIERWLQLVEQLFPSSAPKPTMNEGVKVVSKKVAKYLRSALATCDSSANWASMPCYCSNHTWSKHTSWWPWTWRQMGSTLVIFQLSQILMTKKRHIWSNW